MTAWYFIQTQIVPNLRKPNLWFFFHFVRMRRQYAVEGNDTSDFEFSSFPRLVRDGTKVSVMLFQPWATAVTQPLDYEGKQKILPPHTERDCVLCCLSVLFWCIKCIFKLWYFQLRVDFSGPKSILIQEAPILKCWATTILPWKHSPISLNHWQAFT